MRVLCLRKVKVLVLLVAVFILYSICSTYTRKMNEEKLTSYIAKNLQVEYKVLDNTLPNAFEAQITLTNSGPDVIDRLDWQLYFYHFRFIEPESTKESGKAVIADPGVIVHHINGPLFSFEPLPQFIPWEKGTSRVIKFKGEWGVIARTDLMPNWYVSVGGAGPQVVQCTQSENLSYVAPFISPQQYLQSDADQHHPFTPQERYERNLVLDERTTTKQLLPTPLEIVPGEGSVLFDETTWVIVASSSLQNEAQYLSEKTKLPVVQKKPHDKYISLEVKSLKLQGIQVTKETYVLDVRGREKNVVILGHGNAGVFYGIQSLLSMSDGKEMSSVMVYDSPRFAYRGFMLDVSRNFFDKNEVMKIIDFMATYKLNQLHLHLADDEGWRIEIPDLPELTEVGARRGHDLTELNYLLPTLGSGPFPTGLGCGFYSEKDYKEILHHAANHHVTVIPEIDMPGHSNAAIKSMKARYHKYRYSDQEKASEYLLHDLEDISEYHSVQMFKQNVINPCVDSSYAFVDKILQTLIDYHSGIQPLKTFHLGGDEVPSDALCNSSACKKYFEKVGTMSIHQLKEQFVKKVIALGAAKGLHIQAWEDAYYGEELGLFNRATLGGLDESGLITNAWISKWESPKAARAHEMANNDYKVVLTSATHLYFDHHHEPDPEERGLYWATRFTDLRKVFNFKPEDFWANMDEDRQGHQLDRDTICKNISQCLPLEKPQNIIGMEGALWGETVRTVEQLHHMIILRLLALAERSWHRASWETMDGEKQVFKQRVDWTLFVNHLGYKELPKLEKAGFAYYLPLPGAKMEHGSWKTNTAIPNHVVQYSMDGGATWVDIPQGMLLSQKEPFKLATRSFDGKRRSRTIDVPSLIQT